MDNQLPFRPEKTYSAEALSELAGHLHHAATQQPQPVMVCIAGGSATGKSTQVAADLHQLLPTCSQVISQDHFQLGKDYVNATDSPYRWDDPANYGLTESLDLLRQLKSGEPTFLPQYAFSDRKRIGYQGLLPTPVVLFEGLYAGYGALREVADWLIYTEAPLYVRLLKRLFRNTFERYRADPALVCKGFLGGGVLKAHRDLVSQQRLQADLVFFAFLSNDF